MVIAPTDILAAELLSTGKGSVDILNAVKAAFEKDPTINDKAETGQKSVDTDLAYYQYLMSYLRFATGKPLLEIGGVLTLEELEDMALGSKVPYWPFQEWAAKKGIDIAGSKSEV